MNISIAGLSKASVLAALYNASKVQGMGFLQAKEGQMNEAEAQALLDKFTYFDYLHGKVMKVDLAKDDFDPWLYDRDNGQGAAERVVNTLRKHDLVAV